MIKLKKYIYLKNTSLNGIVDWHITEERTNEYKDISIKIISTEAEYKRVEKF